MTDPAHRDPARRSRRRATRALLGAWLFDHIGRMTGIFFGVIALGALAFLAVIGYGPALALLLVIVIGIAVISIGGRMRS